jgi:protein-tyrosine phosphatase
MIDIHCHILPGLDDGAGDLAETLEMCRIALEAGITGIFATPHLFNGMFNTDRDSIETVYNEVAKALDDAGIPLNLYLGSDVHLVPDIVDRLKRQEGLTLNQGRYFLLEPPARVLPPKLSDTVFDLCSGGFVPIITHPERNEGFLQNEGRLLELLSQGALCQITAMSVTGEFGKACERFCRSLIEARAVHFIASDAHSGGWRRPGMAAAVEAAEGLIGQDEARKLVLDNPRAVLENRPIEPVEVTGLPRRKRFWLF